MARVPKQESDTVEFKESWNDKALKDLAAFANTRGGILYVGIRNDGSLGGTAIGDREQLLIASQIDTKLRIAADITTSKQRGEAVLAIHIPRAQRLVRLDGRYYRRMGTASVEMSEDEVSMRLRAQSGQSWDQAPAEATVSRDISGEKVRAFIRSAKSRKPCRLPEQIDEDDSLPIILKNLDLLADSRPTNAAILLFGKQPQRFFRSACIRAGFFRDNNDFDQFPDCNGTLFEQINLVIQQISSIYPVRMQLPSHITELRDRRIETPSFPAAGLRETIVNAAVHRDYTHLGAEIEVKMFPGFISVANPGGLMPEVTLASLKVKPHVSARRNPLLAQILFMDHLVERYGTGTTRIIDECREMGLPAPEFLDGGSFQVIMRRHDIDQEQEGVRLSSRQRAAIQYLEYHESLTPAEYEKHFGVSDRTASRELKGLVDAGFLERIGIRGSLRYVRVVKPSP